ncbi:MAG: F0F1 ATP synthase subunit delta [Patescibacteria group bacterium]|nr:F0F1 ATP synthase subunit delta [Patescibacteria group bacterium]
MKPTAAQYAQAFIEVVRSTAAADQPRLMDGFVQILAADKALTLWPQIEQAIAEQSVERTAAVARAQEQSVIGDALPEMTVAVKSALLGGALIRNGDYLIDSSIAGQLQKLRQVLASE